VNKFASILQTARDPEPQDRADGTPAPRVDSNSSNAIAARPVGRPAGKRTDPEFQQITAYVRKETWKRVKIALLQGGDDPQETSELIEELLADWLAART
jgi:hypothetical protein